MMSNSKQYKMSELRAMSDEELKEVSLQKNAKGNFTVNANNAMKVRNERAGCGGFSAIVRNTSFAATLQTECGLNFTKKFK